MNAANGMFGGHAIEAPAQFMLSGVRFNQFQRQPIGIMKGNDRSPDIGVERKHHILLGQMARPVACGTRRNFKADGHNLTRAGFGFGHTSPGEKRHDCAGRAVFIAIIEMIGARIVKIHGFLDQTQPQHRLIKMQIDLRVAANGGDVMNA